jgi:hypothetical protein
MNIKKLALESADDAALAADEMASLSPPLLCPKGKLYQSQLRLKDFLSLSSRAAGVLNSFLRLWCVGTRKQKELFAWRRRK